MSDLDDEEQKFEFRPIFPLFDKKKTLQVLGEKP